MATLFDISDEIQLIDRAPDEWNTEPEQLFYGLRACGMLAVIIPVFEGEKVEKGCLITAYGQVLHPRIRDSRWAGDDRLASPDDKDDNPIDHFFVGPSGQPLVMGSRHPACLQERACHLADGRFQGRVRASGMNICAIAMIGWGFRSLATLGRLRQGFLANVRVVPRHRLGVVANEAMTTESGTPASFISETLVWRRNGSPLPALERPALADVDPKEGLRAALQPRAARRRPARASRPCRDEAATAATRSRVDWGIIGSSAGQREEVLAQWRGDRDEEWLVGFAGSEPDLVALKVDLAPSKKRRDRQGAAPCRART